MKKFVGLGLGWPWPLVNLLLGLMAPATSNVEKWKLIRDEKGHLQGIEIHREVERGE